MLAEFLQKLLDVTEASQRTKVEHDVLPDKLLVTGAGGSYSFIDVPPEHRRWDIFHLSDLVELAKENAGKCLLFHSARRIVLLFDRAMRREFAVLRLEPSARWLSVVGLEKPMALDARGAVRFLRQSLGGTGPGTDLAARALSRLDFQRRSDGRAAIEHGRESLGRAVELAVQQADDVPESFTIRLPIYNTSGLVDTSMVGVDCNIYLDLEAEKVVLQLAPDEASRAMAWVQDAIGDLLRERTSTPSVYYGTPNELGNALTGQGLQ